MEYISGAEPEDPIKTSLRKYLIISSVSLVEDILSLLTVRVIDQNKLPIASIIGAPNETEANKWMIKFGKERGITLTNGLYVALRYGFANPDTIDKLFTEILKLDNGFRKLNMTFFDAVRKIDWYNPYKYFKGSRPMTVNWNRFMDMFELRHKIVHNVKDVDLSNTILTSNCDNVVNFLEAAIFIVDPVFRKDVIYQLKSKKRLK